MNVAVVVPTCRPERLAEWYAAWAEQLGRHKATLYVIHDAEEVSAEGVPAIHRCWTDIDKAFGDSACIFPRHTDNIRCFGFWLAVRDGADIVVTLDDDVVPEGDSLGMHLEALAPVHTERWAYAASVRTRGMPYRSTGQTVVPMISHGLWTGVPDLDGPCQLLDPAQEARGIQGKVERGMYFPQSGMNLAFRKEILPALLWPPMGDAQPYSRFGDIWAGTVSQRVCAHLGWPVMNAFSWVHHTRLSDVFENLVREAPGIRENERFWTVVDRAPLTELTAAGCVREIASEFLAESSPFYHVYGRDLLWWCNLVEPML